MAQPSSGKHGPLRLTRLFRGNETFVTSEGRSETARLLAGGLDPVRTEEEHRRPPTIRRLKGHGDSLFATCERRMPIRRHSPSCRSTWRIMSTFRYDARQKRTNMKHHHFIVAAFVSCVWLSPDSAAAQCRGYAGPGGPCSTGPGGGLSAGPGGGLNAGPGGGLNAGPGGGLYTGPGGGMYAGPGGGLYTGPGGGMYAGPGGGLYPGPGGGVYSSPGGKINQSGGSYHGPWGPCITGVKGPEWTRRNCPQ